MVGYVLGDLLEVSALPRDEQSLSVLALQGAEGQLFGCRQLRHGNLSID